MKSAWCFVIALRLFQMSHSDFEQSACSSWSPISSFLQITENGVSDFAGLKMSESRQESIGELSQSKRSVTDVCGVCGPQELSTKLNQYSTSDPPRGDRKVCVEGSVEKKEAETNNGR